MNEGLKVKLHGALRWAGDRQREERESSFRSCTQALSADVCSSVPYEAPLWAELLLVHYGWGAILRRRGCCVLIFEWREMTPGCCQILSWGLYTTRWVQTCRYSLCSNGDLIPVWSVHAKRREEVNRLVGWVSSSSHRQCTLRYWWSTHTYSIMCDEGGRWMCGGSFNHYAERFFKLPK